jgi:hypothetical protein
VKSFILFYSEIFLRFKYEVQEILDKIEFKIDKEKARFEIVRYYVLSGRLTSILITMGRS